ncbi:amino acid/polyamine transporter I [Aspergillus lucknowensis]|uniref:Amino acid/polyamine transporter I n=1 Tax=Aspergillus lucknowensis TaxID=176173 RepID=A0ABR4L913_9EURO
MEKPELQPSTHPGRYTPTDPTRPRDDLELARIGKAPALKAGGPAGAIYGYLLVWLGSLCTMATLSELVSMAPTSGGQYHWVAILAPASCSKFLCFTTGWLIILGWLGALSSGAYLASSQILGFVAITRPSFEPQPYQIMLLYWAYIMFATTVNIGAGSLLPKFEGIVLILHVVGFIVFLVPLAYLGDHASAKDVFTTFRNGGDWPSMGLSFFVGMLGATFAFTGCDAAIHMTEETKNATSVIPLSIMISIGLNGLMGLGILLVALFSVTNTDHVLNSPTGYPFIQMLLDATNSIPASIAIASIIPITGVATAAGNLAAASRMVWAFARDHGCPKSWRVHEVDSRAIPLYSISIVAGAAVLLSLIILASGAALNAVVSLTVSSLFLSYLLATGLLLYHRLRGVIGRYNQSVILSNTTQTPLTWGPFHIPHGGGIVVNLVTVCYLAIAVFFSFWPPASHVTPLSMNWATVPTFATGIFSSLYYFCVAKRTFTGPVVEVR